MESLNRAYIIGTVAVPAELRTTASGAHVARLSLATERTVKVGEEWTTTTDYHRIVATGADALYLADRATKGDPVAVECSIRPQTWTDKDGRKHEDVALHVERVMWIGRKPAKGAA